MADSTFVYVTYIRTTLDKLWAALTEPELTRQYWFATVQDSAWRPGASWEMKFADGRVADQGEILDIDPPHKLVLSWQHQLDPAMKAEGFSRMSYQLEQVEETVKLTLTHTMPVPGSLLIDAVSRGWPAILSSLKSLLETGQPIRVTTKLPEKD